MEEFRVPQQEVAVEVMLQNGKVSSGHMFVPVVGVDAHPAPLTDRLNGNERFMPFTIDSHFEMVNKTGIRWVKVHGPVPAAAEDEGGRDRILALELDDGELVEGHVHYLMPHERSRLLDFLNVAPRFIEVLDDNCRTLVNLQYVLRIRALSPDPA